MKGRRYILGAIGLVFAIAALFSEKEGTSAQPQSQPRGCSVSDLSYSAKMKSQIQELCEFGLSRSKAIENLQEVYRSPSINPEAAVRIVKLGYNLGAHHQDPFKR